MKITIATGIINLITSIIYFVTFLLSQNVVHGLLSLIYLIVACFFAYIYFNTFNNRKT